MILPKLVQTLLPTVQSQAVSQLIRPWRLYLLSAGLIKEGMEITEVDYDEFIQFVLSD